jgi:outer membrane protein assembly factor BamB
VREPSNVLFFAIGGHVVAVDAVTGAEIWRTKLKSMGDVTIHLTLDAIFAGTAGELFCLDPATGALRWKNGLAGLGLGLLAFAESTTAVAAAAARAADG